MPNFTAYLRPSWPVHLNVRTEFGKDDLTCNMYATVHWSSMCRQDRIETETREKREIKGDRVSKSGESSWPDLDWNWDGEQAWAALPFQPSGPAIRCWWQMTLYHSRHTATLQHMLVTRNIIPKTIGNRKRDCAWGWARGINTTRENLQIAKHKSVRWAKRTPSWFVLCDLQIFSGGVYPPSSTSRTISFSISNSFWY